MNFKELNRESRNRWLNHLRRALAELEAGAVSGESVEYLAMLAENGLFTEAVTA